MSILNYAQLEQAIFKRLKETYDYTFQLEEIERCRRSLKYQGREAYKKIKKIVDQCLMDYIFDYVEPMSVQDAHGDIDRYLSKDNPPKTFYQYYTDMAEKDDLFLIRVSYDIENMDVTIYLDILSSKKEITDNLVTIFEKGYTLDPFSFLDKKEDTSTTPTTKGFTLHPVSKLLAMNNVDISRLFDILYYENHLSMGKISVYNSLDGLDIRVLQERFKFIKKLSLLLEEKDIYHEVLNSTDIIFVGEYRENNYLPFVIEIKSEESFMIYTIRAIKEDKYKILEQCVITATL